MRKKYIKRINTKKDVRKNYEDMINQDSDILYLIPLKLKDYIDELKKQ